MTTKATPVKQPRSRSAATPAVVKEAATVSAKDRRMEEKTYIFSLISDIVRDCPRRKPTSEDEKRAQMRMKDEFGKVGLAATEHPFTFNENLYANMALHFGLGVLGTAVGAVAPPVALALHSLAAGSYWAESTRKAYVLRRLFPWKESRNILATAPAEGNDPALRIVFMAHADAAFTGLIFSQAVVERFSGDVPRQLAFLKRSLALATRTTASLAVFDILRMAFGPVLTAPLRPVEVVLTIPAFLTFLLNLEVVIRNEIVPGANDDLSGVAALPVLARRLLADKPTNVEYVFCVTGCEEASLGGGDALRKEMEGRWDKSRTVVIGLDGMTNGELTYLHPEGEVVETPVPQWLRDSAKAASNAEPRFNNVGPFAVPVGGSDIAAWLAHGWDGICLATVDPAIGSPRHYHQPSDIPAHLDMEQLMDSVDFAETLAREIMRRRLD